MGIRVRIGGKEIEVIDYTVRESASPLTAGDSRGGVGSITFTIPAIDPDLPLLPSSPLNKVKVIGLVAFRGMNVELVDDRRGITLGTVIDAREELGGATYAIECETRLQSLVIYGVQSQPFAGTLRAAFEYYLGLAGVDADVVFTDTALANRPVSYPGWGGELWYHLKMMAAAQDADIALVSGVILMRPVRERIARLNRDIAGTMSLGAGQLAQSVEIYNYNNTSINGDMVWPVGDLSTEGQIFSVNADDVTEYALELSASLTSVVQPTAQDWVSPMESSNSVYSIISGDGRKVPAQLWTQHGGSVRVILNEDTNTLRLIIRGPRGLVMEGAEGEEAGASSPTSFSLADFSDGSGGSGGRRGSLRLIGSGVAFAKEKITIPTGVSPARTENIVGITIDNPFLSSASEVYRAGTRAALQYAGIDPTLSADVISVNRKGDGGSVAMLTYQEAEAHFRAKFGAGVTYATLQGGLAGLGVATYAQLEDYLRDLSPNQFEVQVFGNVAGARAYDKKSRRWYRIRSAGYDEEKISVSAENDLTYADFQGHYGTRTYAQYDAIMAGMTYEQAIWAGLYG